MRQLLVDILLFLILTALVAGLLACAVCRGQEPEWAVVRVKSHGASGVIIASTPGHTLVLSCGHMFETDADVKKRLIIDGYPQPHAPAGISTAKLLRLNKDLDLSLIEIGNGPYYTIPLGPFGHKCQSVDLISLGYDNMSWPCTIRPAKYKSLVGRTIFTYQPPWHGRSGGALYDPLGKCLVGICQGYRLPYPQGEGMYVSLSTIHTFLGTAGVEQVQPVPQPQPQRAPLYSSPLQCPT